jgi:hypothetical protein
MGCPFGRLHDECTGFEGHRAADFPMSLRNLIRGSGGHGSGGQAAEHCDDQQVTLGV